MSEPDKPSPTPPEVDVPADVDLEAIAKQMADLEEAERQIHTESSASIAAWLVKNYRMAMAEASRIAPVIQHMLMSIGLG